MRGDSSRISRPVHRSTMAPGRQQVPFADDVLLPVLDLHVEDAVDLQDDDAAVGEAPLCVGVPQAA